MAFVPESAPIVRAFLEAEDMADRADQKLTSAHLLLALFTFSNRAQVLLNERNIDSQEILDAMRTLEDESRSMLRALRERARDIARGSGGERVNCLHLLIAITRVRNSCAYRLLERTGTSLTALRNVAVSYVTGNMPRRYRALTPAAREPVIQPRRTRTSVEVQATDPPPNTPTEAAQEAPTARPEPDEFAAVQAAIEAEADQAALAAAAESSARTEPAARSVTPPSQPKDLAELAPALASCGIDLIHEAQNGHLDRALGRERELEALIDILGKRRANNPVLVGSPGVGKTAIVEGLAVKIADKDQDVTHFHDRFVVALDTGALVAGTSLRGAFSERLGAIKEEVAAARGRILVFIDELHTLIGAGSSGDGPQDAANELKTALARGEFPCIGATTSEEYKKYIEKDAALERRFSPITVDEPTVDEAILILEGAVNAYADHHQVAYSLDAVQAAVQLGHRFIPERKLPDKAFAVIDLAGSRARRRCAARVEQVDVARIINEWTGVPLERLAGSDADRFNDAEALIAERFIGHPTVVSAVCRALRRGLAGFNAQRPMGSFLFLGPTGVGKTELVKVLADFMFGRPDAVVRFDMSELSEAHAVARLIGAQPGYIGYEEGGQLTEALRKRPFQIVLFDEIEKAHHDVLNILLQLLDEGHLTDARGRRVSFTNTLVILTSNLGADVLQAGAPATIGFGKAKDAGDMTQRVLDRARQQITPELWGRLDERLVFSKLTRDQVRAVAALQLRQSGQGLFSQREVSLEWEEPVLDFLLDHGGYSPQTGARGMRQTIQNHIEAPMAEQLLSGALASGDRVQVRVRKNALHIAKRPGPM